MTINIDGSLFDMSKPKIMGILNVTPDSFYDGGHFSTHKEILNQVEKMIDEGADIIDLGGFSSRPGAKEITLEDEEKRVLPTVKLIYKTFKNVLISVDTFRSELAKKSLDNGAKIINDISGGDLDKEMFKTIGDYKAPYIMMHMKGIPKNMQDNPNYEDVTVDIIKDFSRKIENAQSQGINDIIIDPGFGFGKTLNHNYEILNNLELFKILNRPILVGISRKSMIYKVLNNTPQRALTGTISLNTIALIMGANLLRVHDVKEARETINLFNYLKENV